MRILILGAAGQIARLLTNELLSETDHTIVLQSGWQYRLYDY